MTDLVRFHIFRQTEFDENDLVNEKVLEGDFMSFSAAKRRARELYARDRVAPVVTQTNPRRSGPWHNVRMWFG